MDAYSANTALGTTPRTVSAVGEIEDLFWQVYGAYPKKPDGAKIGYAKQAFLRLEPDPAMAEAMIAAIERERMSDKWRRGYIPSLETWLSRWGERVQVKSDTASGETKDDAPPVGFWRGDMFWEAVRKTAVEMLHVPEEELDGYMADCWRANEDVKRARMERSGF